MPHNHKYTFLNAKIYVYISNLGYMILIYKSVCLSKQRKKIYISESYLLL